MIHNATHKATTFYRWRSQFHCNASPWYFAFSLQQNRKLKALRTAWPLRVGKGPCVKINTQNPVRTGLRVLEEKKRVGVQETYFLRDHAVFISDKSYFRSR